MFLIETNSVSTESDSLNSKKSKQKHKRFPRPVHRFPRASNIPIVPDAHYRIIAKKQLDEEGMKKWLATTHGWLIGLTTDVQDNPTKLYDYQTEHLMDNSLFRIVDKSRQTGFSYIKAAEAVAKSHLKLLQTSIFISITQEEANEKIRFARALYESLPEEYKRERVIDNKQSLEFSYKGHLTRILSFAQRQPRGKGNNTDILLDEFAHMMWAREIYAAALPVITRGTGSITLGSSPLGKDSKHYEIFNDKKNYPHYSRMRIFWWDCPEICTNVEEARKLAPYMETRERVFKYGTTKLKEIYRSNDEEFFKQEYELYCADSTLSYYPLELIMRCAFEDESKIILEGNIDPDEITVGWAPIKGDSGLIVPDTIMSYYKSENINWYCDMNSFSDSEDVVDKASGMIDNLLLNMSTGGFGRKLLMGMDVGRSKDSSEISLFEEKECETHNLHIERMGIELIEVPFRKQKEIIKLLLNRLPIEKFSIDGTLGSIAVDMAEDLVSEYPSVVESIQFDLESKARMAKNFRFRLEDRTIALMNDSDSIKQIHAIKKTITESSNTKFGVDKGKNHHGDKFWAKALASIGGNSYDRDKILKTDNIIRLGNHRSFNQNSNIESSGSIVKIATDSFMKHIGKEIGEKKLRLPHNDDIGPLSGLFFDNHFHRG